LKRVIFAYLPRPMFTLWFVAFLLADIFMRSWIALRQIRHVRAHRDLVPAEFSERISLRSHQRAADYTCAKARVNWVEYMVEAALLLGFTLLGGLQWLDITLGRAIENELLRQMALIGSVMLIVGVVNLPFSVWRKFKLEARFGFNRVTPRLFISDTIKGVLLSLVLGAPLVALVLWVMDQSGPAWPVWAWVVWVSFNLLVLWLFPT